MKTWTRMAIGVAALALSVGIGAGAAAMYGSDAAPKQQLAAAPEATGDDPAAGGGDALAASCLAGATDCNDAPSVKYDSLEASMKCAADAANCAGPAACPPDGCSAISQGSCKTGTAPDGSTFETCVGCGYAEPAPGPLVDPAVPVDPSTDLPLGVPEHAPVVIGPAVDLPLAPDFDPTFAGTGCLGLDPCTVSSRPLCLPGDCVVSSDGAVACPDIPPCEIQRSLPGETDVKPVPPGVPCAVSPCLGNDPFAGVPASCPSDPCTVYLPNEPHGVLCNPDEPCAIPDPVANAPQAGVRACPPFPGHRGGGTSGSGGSDSGGTTIEPAPPTRQ